MLCIHTKVDVFFRAFSPSSSFLRNLKLTTLFYLYIASATIFHNLSSTNVPQKRVFRDIFPRISGAYPGFPFFCPGVVQQLHKVYCKLLMP